MEGKFWKIKNISPNEGELILYGDISSEKPWWDDSGEGIYPKQFADDLKSLGNIQNLTVRLNSNGGDVFAATAIYTQLKNHSANVTIMIDGIAASAATIIAMAGDTVKAPSNAIFMIHDPLVGLFGYYNTADMDKLKMVLETIKESIMNAYVSKANTNKDDLAEMMKNETWMTAVEAQSYGFIDEIMYNDQIDASITDDNRFMVVNSVLFDMSTFKTRPNVKPGPIKNNITPVQSLKTNLAIQNKGVKEKVEIKNLEELKQQYPSLYSELVNQVQTDERNRLKSIDDISATIDPALIAKAKYEEPMTAQELAFESLKADAAKGKNFVVNRQQELEPAKQVIETGATPGSDEGEESIINKIAAAANLKRGGNQ